MVEVIKRAGTSLPAIVFLWGVAIVLGTAVWDQAKAQTEMRKDIDYNTEKLTKMEIVASKQLEATQENTNAVNKNSTRLEMMLNILNRSVVSADVDL